MGKSAKNVTEKKRDRQEAAAVEAIARIAKSDGLVLSERALLAEEQLKSLSVLPSVFVFDIDDTIWVGDIDMTSGPPFRQEGRGLPVIARKGGHGDKVVPFLDVPEVFDWLEAQGIKVAVCTHSSRPSWANGVFEVLETAAGTKYADLLAVPIDPKVRTKDKNVHLLELATALACPSGDMVFFDDKDHNVKCGTKAGCTSVCTPQGLTWDLFVQCCAEFEQKKTGNPECAGAALLEVLAPAKAAALAVVKPALPKGGTPGFARLGMVTATTATPGAVPAIWKPQGAIPSHMVQGNMWGPMWPMFGAAQMGPWGPY